jgi:hypothetical protein
MKIFVTALVSIVCMVSAFVCIFQDGGVFNGVALIGIAVLLANDLDSFSRE